MPAGIVQGARGKLAGAFNTLLEVDVSESERRLMDRREIEATRRPFAEARPLAGPPYRDRAIFEAELEVIFSGGWVCVAHQDALRAAGDFVTREIGDESVLVVRGSDDIVRAFFNVCRHRGTRLLEASNGSGLERIRCPYHAWAYGLDGALQTAPLMDGNPGFDASRFPLAPIRCETWEGFVFVCLDDTAAPLATVLSDFPDLSAYGLADLRSGATHEYEIAANWKLVCENYGECYHCPGNHPQLNPISHFRSGGNSFEGKGFCGGPMRLNDGCTTMTLDGRSSRRPLPGLEGDELRLVHYFNIYPAFLLSLHPDYVLTHTVWPLDLDRSLIRCEWLFAAEAFAQDDFDPSDAVDFWHMTNEQDWRICEQAQKGVRSRGFRPARYQSLEETIYFFDNWYLRAMESRLLGNGAGGGATENPAG